MISRTLALLVIVLSAACTSNVSSWDNVDESENALTICAAQTGVRGIDVSVYQGEIDWMAAKSGGVRFASMRLANNLTLDTTFVRNWNASKSAGVIRGAYQFFNPHADALAQANLVIDTLRANGFGRGDLPPEIDVEWPATASRPLPAPAAYAAQIKIWVDAVRAAFGVDPIVYTGGPYWTANVKTNEFANLPLWHAEYPNYIKPGDARNMVYDVNVTPAPLGGCPTHLGAGFATWKFWQFAGENGRAPGVKGGVDVNIFNGSYEDLQRLARDPALDPAKDAGAPDASNQRRDAGSPKPVSDVAPSAPLQDASDPGESGCSASPARGATPWTYAGLVLLLLSQKRRRRSARSC